MNLSNPTATKQGTSCPYTVNKRYLHVESGLPLTVRYIGPLPPSSTADHDKPSDVITWIGVEWDDPSRGKHSGTYRDVHVFHTRVPGAASFLKFKPIKRHTQPPTSTSFRVSEKHNDPQLLDPGIGLFQAIYERYISSNDPTAGEAPVDKIVLGSSNGHILVEMPNIDKVLRRLRKGLEPASECQTSQNGGDAVSLGIKEVGLEGEWVYGVEVGSDTTEDDVKYRSDVKQWMTLKGKLTNVNSLNLSHNLIPSWKELAAVCAELPNLKTLIINYSRLEPLDRPLAESLSSSLKGSSNKVEQLHICNSLISWQDVVLFSSAFPAMRTLDVAGNPLLDVSTTGRRQDSELPIQFSANLAEIDTLDASGCSLKNWADVGGLLRHLPRLQSLNLSENPMASIDRPSPSADLSALPPIHTLILRGSQVRDWESIDNLHAMFGASLRTFKYSLSGDSQDDLHSQESGKRKWFQGRSDDRVFLIAKLGGLENLNGTTITKQERTDAERFYLTQAVKELGPGADEAPGWGRLKKLKAKHGASDTVGVNAAAHITLKSKMMDIRIEAPDLGFEPLTISILPTAPMKLLKTKIARQLGVPLSSDFTLAVREAGNGETRDIVVDERANVASLELGNEDALIVGIK